MTDTFCQFPWTSLMVDLERDLWRWCPNVPARPGFAGYYPYSKDLDSVRDAFTAGDKPPQCRACWQMESLGFKSFRTAHKGNSPSNVHEGLRFLDVKLGTTCDCACATCGPVASSRWKERYTAEPGAPYSPKKITAVFKDTANSLIKLQELISNNIQSLERINITGGEPTADPMFFQLLAHLNTLPVVKDRVVLRLVTNANHKDDVFVSRLRDLRSNGWRLNIIVSLDAAGPDNDFIRAGSNWSVIEPNVRELIDIGYCQEFNIVLSPFNINSISSIPTWLENEGFIDIIKPNLITPYHPFNISVLGGMAIYLVPAWKENHKEHVKWRDVIEAVNKSARKQRFVFPDRDRLDMFMRYVDWYSETNGLVMTTGMKKFYYLADIFKRQPGLFGKETVTLDEQDPV